MTSKKITASIITIGDELLIGQTIDTNSAWIGQQLNKLGVWVSRRVAVGDVWNDIWKALDEETNHANIIFITGGLGPTADDITKPLLCRYFGGALVVNEDALRNVERIFSKYNRPILDSNLKQALVPDVCTVIQNKRGTAPGMLFRKEGKIFISMPGVPTEMKGMMEDYVLPNLPNWFTLPAIVHRTLLTAGIGESVLAEHIKNFEASLPPHIKLAYLPNYSLVRLRLTAAGSSHESISEETDRLFNELYQQLRDVTVATEDIPLEEVVGRILQSTNKKLTTAESCTGGYIAHLLTSVPGSSAYFTGGVVSYSNQLKQKMLGVKEATIKEYGAVSEATVTEMALGGLATTDADYSIAVSGIMGPTGGTSEKPVGTVWIAVAGGGKVTAQQFHFRFNRLMNIELTATNALVMLWKMIRTLE